ncbi:signal peptidase I [Finegoldia magna]|uniref:Signal peptidase I n=1 Tax=Finegoldia magna (strain ATCC 29328 / DSM 20472 / WAL 2508) TaxID=334413 RepID=B0S4J0_FINM2|nr:signal peptidase I [Finegoldia magna]UEA71138.1 signal peptidase I [Finegoldia magna]BAG09181.1 signal peptidase I [Finegoldia magna ATCC 29328]
MEVSKRLDKILKYTFVIVLMIFLFKIFLIDITIVRGSSMFPTITKNEMCFYKKIQLDQIKHDDIAIIKDNYTNQGYGYLIKRIIACPGDTLVIEGGKLKVNGVEKNEFGETMVDNDIKNKLNLKIGENEYFVMGDNRRNSMDSRYFGCVKKEDIKGLLINNFLER